MISRSQGGNTSSADDADSMDSGVGSGNPNQPDENKDEYEDDFFQKAYGAPGFSDAVDPGLGYIDDFFSSGFGPNIGFNPNIDPNTGYVSGTLEGIKAAANPGSDAIDVSNMVDAQLDALEKGLDVNVGYDPESGTLTFDGPDAANYALSSIAEGIGGLASLGSDFYRGMTSLTPAGILRDILIDKKGNMPGGYIRQNIFDRQEPFITDPLGRGAVKTLLGDATGSIELKTALGKTVANEFDKLTSKEKTEVEEKVKKGKSPEKAIEEVKMTRENFSSTMERLFGDQLREGLYE